MAFAAMTASLWWPLIMVTLSTAVARQPSFSVPPTLTVQGAPPSPATDAALAVPPGLMSKKMRMRGGGEGEGDRKTVKSIEIVFQRQLKKQEEQRAALLQSMDSIMNDRKRDEDRIEDRASKDGFPVFPVVIRAALRLRVRFRRRLCGGHFDVRFRPRLVHG